MLEKGKFLTADRPPIPDAFFCTKCRFISYIEDDETIAWFQANRPDLFNGTMLSQIIGCRCIRDAASAEQARKENANLPNHRPRTMENFKMVSGTHAMVKATEEFLRGEGPPVLTLIGITGCGKSHVLEGIGRTTLHQGKSLRYERAGDFVDYLRHTFQEDQTRDIYEVMKWYDSFHMLLIDDIGMESSTNWAVGKLTSLVDKRISDGSRLAVATNLIDEPEMAKSWGPRLASRLYGTNTGEVRVIRCEAGDYRKAGE